jgi:hypothetical protein
MRFFSSRLAISAVVIGFGFGVGQASAADADAIAKSLVAAFAAIPNAEASYADASANGDDVTVNELKVTFPEGKSLTIPAVVINGAADRDKGGFTATSISFDGGSVTDDKGTMKWETGSVEDAVVPSPDEIKAKAKMAPFSKGSIAKIDLSGSDMPAAIDIDEVAVSMEAGDDGTPNKFTTDVNGMKLPQALFPQMAAVFSAMGYTDSFDVSIAVVGGYEHTTDTVNLESFTIDTANVGKLAVDAKLSGIPLSKMGDDAARQDLKTNAKLESFHLRFDNAGIVEKVLDMQAQQSGMKRADIVAQWTAALPLLLNIIQNDAFQGKIATAVTAFLNDPKSITLTAAPSAPVGLDAVFTAIGAAPQTVPDMVGADITANN